MKTLKTGKTIVNGIGAIWASNRRHELLYIAG